LEKNSDSNTNEIAFSIVVLHHSAVNDFEMLFSIKGEQKFKVEGVNPTNAAEFPRRAR
jgi:hypothetical protein